MRKKDDSWKHLVVVMTVLDAGKFIKSKV